MLPGLGVERLEQYGGQVAARVAVRVLDLEPEPDRAVLAHQCGCGAREQRAEQHACGRRRVSVQRRRGRRDELAQRDHVGLAREPLERTGDEDRRGAGGAAVAGLVAAAGAARDRAGEDRRRPCRRGRSAGGRRCGCAAETSFPWRED